MRRIAALAVVVALGVAAAGGSAAGTAAAAPSMATPGPVNAPEYWFDSWRIQQLWQDGIRGQGLTIGEIDTGVNARVPQLRGKVLAGTNLGDAGGDGRTDRDVDPFGHGTAMASIMVGGTGPFGVTGLAPDAKILPVAVPLTGTTDAGSDDRLPDAITWAADHGADIINMSLGGRRSASGQGSACPPDEQSAVFHALRKGAIVVAAVGNDGPSRNEVEEPGVCLGVVSVGAVDASGTVASFSSREPYLTVTAPGVNVPSLGRVPGTAYSGDGTSQAAAIVSGVLALAWSAHRSLSGSAIVARLLATVDNRRAPPDPAYGYGLVNGYRAVQADVPASAPNPLYTQAAPFLARDGAFQRPTPTPRAAATGELGDGGYAVGAAPRMRTPAVVGGIALAVIGLALLAVFLVLAVRASRRGPPAAAHLPRAPAPEQAEPSYLVPPSAAEPTPPRRPRPGPRQEPDGPDAPR